MLKARNSSGAWVDGSVGKCFGYGAQRGRFYVQGGADARAGIRLSGAEVLFGGDLRGFAFEYMTGGRAVVLGDPGRWICSGMSGGAVFLRHDPERGLDERGLRDRFAKGAKVNLRPPSSDEDLAALRDMVGSYATLLQESGQTETAAATRVAARRSGGALPRRAPRRGHRRPDDLDGIAARARGQCVVQIDHAASLHSTSRADPFAIPMNDRVALRVDRGGKDDRVRESSLVAPRRCAASVARSRDSGTMAEVRIVSRYARRAAPSSTLFVRTSDHELGRADTEIVHRNRPRSIASTSQAAQPLRPSLASPAAMKMLCRERCGSLPSRSSLQRDE